MPITDMKSYEILKKNGKYFFGILLAISILIPRLVASFLYDALEDELLAIGFNIRYSAVELIFAPDFTHPGLWYFFMEIPTSFFELNASIFYYRLTQIVIFLFFSLYLIKRFKNKFSHWYLLSFFGLLLSNVYLIHLTMQHRMYSMVLGLCMVYSFEWYLVLVKEKKELSLLEILKLSSLATASFLSNYSSVWVILVWPLSYFLIRLSKKSLKHLFSFFSIFLIEISWFIPIFIRNAQESIGINQWAPDLTLLNVLLVIGNYFGIMKKFIGLNLALIFMLIVFAILVSHILLTLKKKHIHFSIIVSTFLVFLLYLSISFLSGNSLLYARTSLPIILPIYMVFAKLILVRDSFIKSLILTVVIIQFSQFFIYFNPNLELLKQYDYFNYHKNPINVVLNYDFENGDCVIPIPFWNLTAVEYFAKEVTIFTVFNSSHQQLQKNLETCKTVYVTDQTSVDRKSVEESYIKLNNSGLSLSEVKKYENQKLFKGYILNKESNE